MRPVCLFLLLLFGVPWLARGWGMRGHEAMARVAQGWLSNHVAARVSNILGTNDLASVALWADHLRDAQRNRGPLRADPEAREFNRRFPGNDTWHFVNLPLGTTDYGAAGRFASTNDIVHATQRCLAVLEGGSAEMSKRDALRWLVHLVGDIHQPLHVGCGYYRLHDDGMIELIREPGRAGGQPHDRGGNLLRYAGNQNLHGYWDVSIVDAINTTDEPLESTLRKVVQPQSWSTLGSVGRWPEAWAEDAVVQARGAYENIELLRGELDGAGVVTNISVKLPADYQSKQEARALDQLSKSAFHLAEVLNRLRWD